MRPFEILIAVLIVFGPLIPLMSRIPFVQKSSTETDLRILHRLRSKFITHVYCLILVLVLASHFALDGAHWQMLPAYFATLLLVPLLLLAKLPRLWIRIDSVCIWLLVLVTCCLATILPMFMFPPLTGQYEVGTRIVPMTDNTRRESAGNDLTLPRQFVTQVWYPARPSHNPYAPYRRRTETTLVSSYLSVDWTHSRYNAPAIPSPAGFPILIYNPGWGGRRTQDTLLTEELASHGYFVIAVDHPYNSAQVELGDGLIIHSTNTPQFYDETSSKDAIYTLINDEVEKETADTLSALSQFEQMNKSAESPFYQRMDLTKIGALGYSLGGAVAAEAAYENPRIHAVADLDTPLYAHAGKYGISQPFLLLSEELAHSTKEMRSQMSFGRRRNVEMDEDDYDRQLPLFERFGDYHLALKGTLHTSFQDGILFSPIKSISGAGNIAPQRLILILRQYTLAFFDHSLRGIDSSLLSTSESPFPEVRVVFSSQTAHSH